MIRRSVQTAALAFVIIASCLSVFAQAPGRLKGVVRTSSGAPTAGAIVVVTNQVTRKTKRVPSSVDGSYSVQLPAGAYRVALDQPHTAQFDKDKNYGEFAIARGDTLENVMVEAGKETVIDISIAPGKPVPPQRRETPDRWRITFPEYDRYGNRGARGRDIPFKKGRWWDPYNQNVLKGDYPIVGDKLFMILTAVSSTNAEQRRAPTPSGVSAVDPLSAEFFGRPEQFAANETLQFSFELFHGDTSFKPRDWAIKFSPTFSVPNYLDARENGVVNIDVRRGTNRTDWHASLEEAFGEVKLADINANYDFVS
ncbi:MAG TPA: carboxypeptidase-like regulatory domain-containing protein, partial [Pyrinomonadaceae bacterium]|nr:carboxypeptidase-like regulatory domain-containing protein [Pyrinomonadaceae bacterium]